MNGSMREQVRLSWLEYHGLDHWPFTRACRSMPKGGGFFHLRLAWDYRRRDQAFSLWHRWQCRRGKHVDVLYSIGQNPGKACGHCSRPGILTPEEIQHMRDNWPSKLRFPGGNNVDLEEEEGGGADVIDC